MSLAVFWFTVSVFLTALWAVSIHWILVLIDKNHSLEKQIKELKRSPGAP